MVQSNDELFSLYGSDTADNKHMNDSVDLEKEAVDKNLATRYCSSRLMSILSYNGLIHLLLYLIPFASEYTYIAHQSLRSIHLIVYSRRARNNKAEKHRRPMEPGSGCCRDHSSA